MLRLTLIAAFVLLASRGYGTGDDKANDLERLQGRWRLTEADDSDGIAKKGSFSKYTLVIKNGQMAREMKPGEIGELRPFQIYPEKVPKQIDFKSGGKHALDRFGVYSIVGDTLRICFSAVVPAEVIRRPSDFTTQPGAGRVLMVFTRVKDEGTANAQERTSVKETKAKIRKLQQERVEVLHQAAQVALAFYREGARDFRTVYSAQQDLLEAKLDMAETREERMAVLTSQLKTANGLLAVAEEMFQAGKITVLDVHQARSKNLSIEIRLLKMRSDGQIKFRVF